MPLPPCTSIASLDDLAAHLGAVVLGDRRRHRRLLAAVDRGGGGLRQRADRVGLAGDARQRFLDALEAADRQAELLADARVGAGDHAAILAPPLAVEGRVMARPTDRHSTSMRQPWPM
jgi:hypothetical protein